MAEFLSLILFIGLVSGALYLFFTLILPALVIYLGGVTMALIFSTYLIHQDKHRARFSGGPVSGKTVRAIALVIFIMPLIHAGIMLLFNPLEWILWVLGLNLLLALLWLVLFLANFRRTVRMYKKENGELKALLSNIVKKKEALSINADSLKCLMDEPQSLEPWETAVIGEVLEDPDVDRRRVEDTISQLSDLIMELDDIHSKYNALVLKCKEKHTDSCEECKNLEDVIKRIDPAYKELIDRSARIIRMYDI